MWRFC